MADEDDVPQLSAETMTALQDFLNEKNKEAENPETLEENWQLSQFWYDEPTCHVLADAALSVCSHDAKIALISCPTLYKPIKSRVESKQINLTLFEFDRRFEIFKPEFQFYDYNEPTNLPDVFRNCFDVVLIDPPFLSDECLSKTAETVGFLRKPHSKVIVCTGAVMENLASRLLNVEKVDFTPTHRNNLGNEFICMTNFGDIKF